MSTNQDQRLGPPRVWSIAGTREDESGLLEGTVSIVRREDATVKSTRERAEEKRAEKLDHVREQVQTGSLVIGR